MVAAVKRSNKITKILHYLPNKKFILISIASLLVIGGGFSIFKIYDFRNLNRAGQNEEKQLTVQQPVTAVEIAKNNGSDDLKDWEKTLAETIKSQNSPSIESPSTLTEALAQNFFGDFMSAKETANETGNSAISELDQINIANSFWTILGNFKETGQLVYNKTDIKISSSDDAASIKNYGNGLALIIKKYFDPLPENEMEILKRAVKNQDANELKKLMPVADAYRNTAKEILSLKVPPSYAVENLYLINNFNAIAQDLDIMQKTFEDPGRAFLAYDRFRQEAIVARFILRDLNNYFSYKNIAFENGEPGEFFKIYLD